MSGNNSIPHSEAFTQAFVSPKVEYLESRLSFFSALAQNAMSASWSRFWLSQVESIQKELKAKMVNPVIKSSEASNEHS